MTGHCTAVLSSTTRETPAYRALDVDGIGSWVEATLEDLASCDALWRRARACRPPRWFIAGCTIRMRRLSRSTGFTEIAALESTVISTGTWSLAMRRPRAAAAAQIAALDERRAAVGLYAAKPLAIRLDGCRAAWREEAERLQLAA